MRVLSLFDGISCARVALDRAGLPVTEYLASEIDPNAIKVSQTNYPDIVRLGDVREVWMSHLKGPIDLLIGGSPCQDLSIAKKNRQGLAGNRSGLFWEYVRIKELVKPRWFILENVASMPKADRDTITEALGVEPILIDAGLVSAQSRKRLFWTNIPTSQPEDRGILLKDILQPDAEVDDSFQSKGTLTPSAQAGRKVTKKVGFIGDGEQHGQGGQAHRVYATDGKTPTLSSFAPLVKLGHVGPNDGQGSRVYSPDGKSVTLSAHGGGGGAKTGLYWIPSPYPIHIPDGDSTQPIRVGHEQRRKLKNGKRADDDPTIEPVRRIETRNDDKCGTLTTVLKDNHIVHLEAHRIRKLTPIECERLQGLPDGYTACVAKTHRYKTLGNAFNVDVIAHIIRGIRTRPSSPCP